MEITEQQLGEYGGWQAMKAAREHVKLGQVDEAKRDEQGFHGIVGSGKSRFRASLLKDSKGRVEGRCACADGQRGVICSHVLAVALQVIKGGALPKVSLERKNVESKTAGKPSALESKVEVAVVIPPIPQGGFHVSIMISQLDKLNRRGTVPVFFQYERDNDEGGLSFPLWKWMVVHGLSDQTQGVRLAREELLSLLENLKGHALLWGAEERNKKAFNALLLSDLSVLCEFKCDNDMQSVEIQLNCQPLYFGDGFSVLNLSASRVALVTGLPGGVDWLRDLMQGRKLAFSYEFIVKNLDQFISCFGNVEAWFKSLEIKPIDPIFVLNIEGGLKKLLVQAQVRTFVGEHLLCVDDVNGLYPIQNKLIKSVFYARNASKEEGARKRLMDAGLRWMGNGLAELSGETEVLRFMAAELPRLRKHFEVVEGVQWQSMSRSLAVIRPQLREVGKVGGGREVDQNSGAGMDWLSLEVAYEADNGLRVSRNEVLRLIRSGQRQGRTADGRRFVLDVEGCEDLEETFRDLSAHLESGGERMAIRRRQVGVLAEFSGKGQSFGELAPALSEEVLRHQLGDLGKILREYQIQGVSWMERLSRSGLGGLLADEMGLGKTVQTLAMIRLALKDKREEPALVICPTSLLGNWRDEARKFVPELRVHVSHDSERHDHWDRLNDYDVIFTSYQLVARDLERLNKVKFSLVVMDEASYVRNAETITAKAVRQLKARCCFALTGTPVENSVKDLWSIFEIVMPGYLPGRESFHERYVKNLAQGDTPQARVAMERLRRLVRPYVLRRTKREVVKELPEKMEQVVWCELTPLQKEVYTRLLEEGREEIRQAKRRSGQGSARMTMFTVLLRLRQICNDVRLLGMRPEESASVSALGGKWERFDEMVQELIEGDHRALVFSQFVGMLKLIREKLDEAGIEYAYLDGSTRDRAAEVAEFQRPGSTKRFFLISLKAGGYGLNLTAADYVLLMDPWWNPAVEAQAIDRAHRIGQGRPVTAERFVMRGTVEEKILQLQAKKRAVMDMALEDDATVMAGLTDEELDEMLLRD